MKDEKIPEEVRKFIVSNFENIGILEVLAILLKDKNKSWDAESLRAVLHSSSQSIDRNLKQLIKLGAISVSDSVPPLYQYAPKTENLDKLLTVLNGAFTIFPIRVIDIIYSRPNDLLRDFSDAFKLRKDPKDG